MFSIRQSVDNEKWIQAAEACSSAFSLFQQRDQADFARIILDRISQDAASAHDKGWRIRDTVLNLSSDPEFKERRPWTAHIEDAREDIMEIYENLDADPNEIAARTAHSILELIFSVQIIAWALTDKNSFLLWVHGEKAHTVFENNFSKAVGAIHWLAVDKLIRTHRAYIGKSDRYIYKVRPAVSEFRKILEGGTPAI